MHILNNTNNVWIDMTDVIALYNDNLFQQVNSNAEGIPSFTIN